MCLPQLNIETEVLKILNQIEFLEKEQINNRRNLPKQRKRFRPNTPDYRKCVGRLHYKRLCSSNWRRKIQNYRRRKKADLNLLIQSVVLPCNPLPAVKTLSRLSHFARGFRKFSAFIFHQILQIFRNFPVKAFFFCCGAIVNAVKRKNRNRKIHRLNKRWICSACAVSMNINMGI